MLWKTPGETNQHARVMDIYLDWTITVLKYIFWPIGIAVYYLGIAVLTVLKLLYQPVAFILQPVFYLAKFILGCFAFPFKLLARLEVSSTLQNFPEEADFQSLCTTTLALLF